MTDLKTPGDAHRENWETPQSVTSRYQARLDKIHMLAIATQSAFAATCFQVGSEMAKTYASSPSQCGVLMMVLAFSWVVPALLMHRGFEREAERERSNYEAEHAERFPGSQPCRLQSFLLTYDNTHIGIPATARAAP